MWVILEESWIGKWFFVEAVVPKLRRKLPPPFVGSFLVLLFLSPVFHLFTDQLLFGKYFDQLALAMPVLVIEKV